jgi:dTDP-4-dehydrorhamnose 3,5-epimerase
MKFTPTAIAGVFEIELEHRRDERGFFARGYCQREFEAQGLQGIYLQSNLSFNLEAGTLRGLHWQEEPHAEEKVVRCTQGAIFDVALDLRRDSPTYLKWQGTELSAENQRSFYIPRGCAHGYLTLTPGAEVHYLVSAFYAPAHERGARWNDPAFAIRWPRTERFILSPRDASHPLWQP